MQPENYNTRWVMWDYCMIGRQKITREFHPNRWAMVVLCRQMTRQFSLTFSSWRKTWCKTVKSSAGFLNVLEYAKAKGPMAVKSSFQVLLRTEPVPVADQWFREGIEGSKALSATQNSLDLPCGMHMTKCPSGIVQAYRHTTRSAV